MIIFHLVTLCQGSFRVFLFSDSHLMLLSIFVAFSCPHSTHGPDINHLHSLQSSYSTCRCFASIQRTRNHATVSCRKEVAFTWYVSSHVCTLCLLIVCTEIIHHVCLCSNDSNAPSPSLPTRFRNIISCSISVPLSPPVNIRPHQYFALASKLLQQLQTLRFKTTNEKLHDN